MRPVTPRQITTYVTPTGKDVFDTWLNSLADSARAKIRARLARLRAGNLGDFKSVGEGVFELRIFFGPGYRIYFGQENEVIVVLLCGGDKSTQTNDIYKAQSYWADYRSRP